MKKRDLAALALIGISAGLALGGCQSSAKRKAPASKVVGAEQMSPDMKAFYNSLSPETQKKFTEMDAQHKMMAQQMANQSCNGRNACAGMGGCATVEHVCAGKNDCKGQGGPPVKDPNKAVEIQYQNQQQQRQSMTGKMINGTRTNQNPSP